MAKNNKMVILLGLFAVLVLAGCRTGGTMGASGSPAKFLETFYKGDGKELYFIKPFKWKAVEGKEWVMLDITYDYDQEVARKLVANFSFYAEKPASSIENVVLKMDSGEKKYVILEKMFVEKDLKYKKYYHNRYTFSMEYEDFKSLVQTPEPRFSLTANGKVFSFYKPKKWKKRSAYIQQYMIESIDLNG